LSTPKPKDSDEEVGLPFTITHTNYKRSIQGEGTVGALCTLESNGSSKFIEDGSGRWKIKAAGKSAGFPIYLSVFGGNLSSGSLITMSGKAQAVVFKQHNGCLRAIDKSGKVTKYVASGWRGADDENGEPGANDENELRGANDESEPTRSEAMLIMLRRGAERRLTNSASRSSWAPRRSNIILDASLVVVTSLLAAPLAAAATLVAYRSHRS